LFDRHLCWHVRAPLDVAAMTRAADVLAGEHDFSAFRASGCEAKSPVRRIDAIRWRFESSRPCLDVFGNGFLKQMVRNIVGTCVEVGRGSLAAERIGAILASRDREQAGPTAPACGLTLMRVYYAEEEYRRALEG
jgi:tRNA pseudouridine38-40 synthase